MSAEMPLNQLGEGAYCSRDNATLYWVDIAGQTVHPYLLPDKVHSSWRLSKEVSFAFPPQDGRLLVGLIDGVYEYDPESGEEIPIALLDLPSGHRLNDGKLDPTGRLWVGTINTADEPSETAALYVLRDDQLVEVEGGYANANGNAWSPDGTVMYHADISRGTWAYDYDVETGMPSNKRVFVRHEDWNPDGLCIDPEGNLLVAVFGGACMETYSNRAEHVAAMFRRQERKDVVADQEAGDVGTQGSDLAANIAAEHKGRSFFFVTTGYLPSRILAPTGLTLAANTLMTTSSAAGVGPIDFLDCHDFRTAETMDTDCLHNRSPLSSRIGFETNRQAICWFICRRIAWR